MPEQIPNYVVYNFFPNIMSMTTLEVVIHDIVTSLEVGRYWKNSFEELNNEMLASHPFDKAAYILPAGSLYDVDENNALRPTKFANLLKQQIDNQIGNIRKSLITDIAGQQATYLIKELEAKAILQNSSIASADVPYLTYESSLTGRTLLETANRVLLTSAPWHNINKVIEGYRVHLKELVGTQTTIPGVAAIMSGIDWQTIVQEASNA